MTNESDRPTDSPPPTPPDAIPPEPGYFRGLGGVLAMAVPVPLLLATFLWVRMPPARIMLAMTAMACAGVGLVRFTRALATGRRDLVSAMLVAGGLGIVAAVVWNEAYLDFVKLLTGHKEVFRPKMWRHFAPFYGRPRVADLLPSLPVIALTIGIWWAARRWQIGRPMRWWGLAAIVLTQAAMIAALAATDLGASDGVARLTGNSGGFEMFRQDARYFRTVHELFAAYLPMMPKLNWLSQHYPPGSQLIFTLEKIYGLRPLGGWVTTLMVCLSTPFVYAAACTLTPKPLARNAAVVAYATASGGLLYPLISLTPAVMLPASIALWAFLRGVRGPVSAVVFGGLFGAAMMAFSILSLSSVFFASVIALVWLACVNWRLAKLLPLAILPIVAELSALTIHHLLRKHAGFDLFSVALVGEHFHHNVQMRSNGFDTFGEWFMRSTANLLAFLLANLPLLGVAVATLLAWRRDDARRLDRILVPAVAISILLAAVSGAFYLETERIWTLYLPVIAIAAGAELARDEREADVRRMVVLATLFVVMQELIFIHGVL